MATLAGSSLLTRPKLFGQAIAAPSSSSSSLSSPSPRIVFVLDKKKPKPPKAAGKALANAECAKWHSPNCRIYLPEGLLDRADVPAYLTGEVLGDSGFDPFGLSNKRTNFDKYRAYELIHGSWAMLGAAGFVLPEKFNKYGASYGPEAVWFKTGALLIDGMHTVTVAMFERHRKKHDLVASEQALLGLIGEVEQHHLTYSSQVNWSTPITSIQPGVVT